MKKTTVQKRSEIIDILKFYKGFSRWWDSIKIETQNKILAHLSRILDQRNFESDSTGEKVATLPVRYTIKVDSYNVMEAAIPDDRGQWIFDPSGIFDVPEIVRDAIAAKSSKFMCHACGTIVEEDFGQHVCP